MSICTSAASILLAGTAATKTFWVSFIGVLVSYDMLADFEQVTDTAFPALPVLSIFSLGQKRGYHIFGVLVWVALVSGLILSQGSPKLMYRNLVNCKCSSAFWITHLSDDLALKPVILFHVFLLMTSYLREKSDRQVFTLRTQLKLQYR